MGSRMRGVFLVCNDWSCMVNVLVQVVKQIFVHRDLAIFHTFQSNLVFMLFTPPLSFNQDYMPPTFSYRECFTCFVGFFHFHSIFTWL